MIITLQVKSIQHFVDNDKVACAIVKASLVPGGAVPKMARGTVELILSWDVAKQYGRGSKMVLTISNDKPSMPAETTQAPAKKGRYYGEGMDDKG